MSYQPPDSYPPVVPGSPPALPRQAYAGPYPPYAQHIVVSTPPTSGLAVASLVFGIFGILGGWCMLGIPCIIAVICGHGALSDTKDGTKGGRGMAVAGLIMGYAFVIPAILIFIFAVFGSIVSTIQPTPTP